jgi:outer membrane protein OmpA-like peptidoglycan-associated protein
LINRGYSLEIIGHASEEGSETYNENLSRRRAEAVADIFRNNGVPL